MASKFVILLYFCVILFTFFPTTAASESNRTTFQWEILTSKNFSSQILLHPHLLLILTLPWSGESQSLMKEIAYQAAYKGEKYVNLKLMVVYRNAEKVLGDALDPTDGITFIFYHHSKAYKYRGRLRAENILSSCHHLMSLQPEELPLKPLRTLEDLETFFKSTDKAVLLLEFCGWTPRLLHRRKDRGREGALHMWNTSESRIFEENLNEYNDRTFPFAGKKHLKGLRNEKITCGVENGLGRIPWFGRFTWDNQTTSLEVKNGKAAMLCTFEEFQRFESFFSKLTSIARDHFLPPERQRFGLVSDPSLLPFLGVQDPHIWLSTVHFAGCRFCSKILREGDDLNNIILMHHSLVRELEGEGHNLEDTMPANKPSMILFVDRSSELSKVRRKSKSALEIFRKFALHNRFSYERIGGNNCVDAVGSTEQPLPRVRSKGISDSFDRQVGELSPAPRLVNFKDKMAFMVIREGGNIDLHKLDGDPQGNNAHDILAYLLQQKNPAFQLKGAKLSALANQVGFQLLSDDFEVKVTDTSQPQNGNGQSERALDAFLSNPERQLSELTVDFKESNSNIVNMMTSRKHLPKEQPEVADEETAASYIQEPNVGDVGNTELILTESAQEMNEGEMGFSESVRTREEKDIYLEDDLVQVTHYDEPAFYLGEGTPSIEVLKESTVSTPGLHLEYDSDMSPEGVAEGNSSIRGNNKDEVELHTFKGSFFFSDGGYQLLRSLTSVSRIPSVVILDPVLRQHYVFPEDTAFSYSALVYFVDMFLNGSFSSYQRSESVVSPREPPFINLDFLVPDTIPKVTVKTFPELVLGFNQRSGSSSNTQIMGHAWKKDVLVLFSNTWCGFCQRMELVVYEVYRAFKGYRHVLMKESTLVQDNLEDVMFNELPSIFSMDCTLNDCSTLLKSIGERELYPMLLLFPAEKKNPVSYQGDMSVTSVMKFVSAHGSNSCHLSENKGILWTKQQKGSKMGNPLNGPSSSSFHQQVLATKGDQQFNNHQSIGESSLDEFHNTDQLLNVGSILVATDKLLNAPPFDKAKILILKANKNEDFQGLIINKHIKWDHLPGLDEELTLLKLAPLSLGGPIVTHAMPLLSFTRLATVEGFLEVLPDIYYGDQIATTRVIAAIKSGYQSAVDYWFFLGYSSWGWIQLFDEVAEGAWHVSGYHVEQFGWPES